MFVLATGCERVNDLLSTVDFLIEIISDGKWQSL